MGNTIIAAFKEGAYSCRATGLWQWDYGQILQITGLPLPRSVEIHINQKDLMITRIGVTEDGITSVAIPNEMLEVTDPITAYIYLHTGDSDGETEYRISMGIIPRPKPIDYDIEDEDVNAAYQALVDATAVMNSGIDEVTAMKNTTEQYMNTAGEMAASAGNSEEAAESAAKEARSWAVGGTGSRDGEDSNNSKWWSDKALESATAAKRHLDDTVAAGESAVVAIREEGERQASDLQGAENDLEEALSDLAGRITLNINNEGNTQIQAVKSTGSSEINKVTAKGSEELTAITTKGTEKVEAIETAGTTEVGKVKAEGDRQIALIGDAAVASEGAKQIRLIGEAGAAAIEEVEGSITDVVADVEAAGDAQEQRVKAAGDTQVDRVSQIGTTQYHSIGSLSSQQKLAITSLGNEVKGDINSLGSEKVTAATTQAKKAESYAVGGTGSRTGEDTDNAKYYYEQVRDIAETIDFDIDDALSSTSTNPVQNKVVKQEFDAIRALIGNVEALLAAI